MSPSVCVHVFFFFYITALADYSLWKVNLIGNSYFSCSFIVYLLDKLHFSRSKQFDMIRFGIFWNRTLIFVSFICFFIYELIFINKDFSSSLTAFRPSLLDNQLFGWIQNMFETPHKCAILQFFFHPKLFTEGLPPSLVGPETNQTSHPWAALTLFSTMRPQIQPVSPFNLAISLLYCKSAAWEFGHGNKQSGSLLPWL